MNKKLGMERGGVGTEIKLREGEPAGLWKKESQRANRNRERPGHGGD